MVRRLLSLRAAALVAVATTGLALVPPTSASAEPTPGHGFLEQRVTDRSRPALPAVALDGAVPLDAAVSAAPPSAPSAVPPVGRATSVPSSARPGYVALPPRRILDTRGGLGAARARIGAGGSVDVAVLGAGGVPSSGVTAVVLNVTATGATTGTYVTVWPTGATRPGTSNVNVPAGATVANTVVATVGAGGAVSVGNWAGSVDVVADVQGYFQAGSGYAGLTPSRQLDTRGGLGAPRGPVGPGRQVDVTFTGTGGVPTTGVSAVALNVTVTGATAATYLTVYPTGARRPGTSNLNVRAGTTVAVGVVAALGTGGKVSLWNAAGSAHVIADVTGWFTAGGDYVPLTPARLLDTRSSARPLGTGGLVDVDATGRGVLPVTGATALVLSVTAVTPTRGGYLSVVPLTSGPGTPTTSSVNFAAGVTTANLVVVRPGYAGWIRVSNFAGSTHVVVDVLGYFRSDATMAYNRGQVVQVGVGFDDVLHPVPLPRPETCAADVSRDGRLVVFTSYDIAALVPHVVPSEDPRGIFVRDMARGVTTAVAVTRFGYESCPLSLSPDGRWLMWRSEAQFFANDLNGVSDIFATDLRDGWLYQLTWNRAANRAPNGATTSGAMSVDARWFVAETAATDLTGSADPNGAVTDVVLLDTETAVPTPWRRLHAGHVGRESVSLGGAVAFRATGPLSGVAGYADGPALWTGTAFAPLDVATGGAVAAPSAALTSVPVISDDGSTAAFWSLARLDAAVDTNTTADLYRRTLAAGAATTLVTRAAAGGASGALTATSDLGISSDGSSVVFSTVADPRLAPSATGARVVYGWSAASGIVVASPSTASWQRSAGVSVTGNGLVASYWSDAPDLSPFTGPVLLRWR